MKKLLLALLVCAYTMGFAQDKATVYVYRTKAQKNYTALLFVDDFHVTDLYDRSFVKIDLSPGKHYISSGLKLKKRGIAMTLEENFKAGQTYHFLIEFNKLKPLSNITWDKAKTIQKAQADNTQAASLFKMVKGSDGFDKILHASRQKMGKSVVDKLVDNRAQLKPNPLLNATGTATPAVATTTASQTQPNSNNGSAINKTALALRGSGTQTNSGVMAAVSSAIQNDSPTPTPNTQTASAALTPTDLTVAQLYEQYRAAIDPQGTLNTLSSTTRTEQVSSIVETNGTSMPNNYVMLNFKDAQGRVVSIMKMPTMSTKTVFDGNSGYTELSNGHKQAMNATLVDTFKNLGKELVQEAQVPPNATISQSTLNGQAVYVVTNTVSNAGANTTMADYYSAETFQKLQTTSKSKANGMETETTITYSGYADFNGVKQPSHVETHVSTRGSNLNSVIRTVAEVSYQYNEPFDAYANKSLGQAAASIASIPTTKLSGASALSAGVASSTGTSGAPSDSKSIADQLANTDNLEDSEVFKGLNKREQAYQLMLKKQRDSGTDTNSGFSTNTAPTVEASGGRERISRMEAANTGTLKYRRSSLYTLMLDDNTREHYDVIKDAFGDTELSEKFNNHNIGPYLVPAHGIAGEKDQTQLIENYLNSQGVARNLVAKWFNRDAKGQFNMNLIAERGQYNASEIDIKVAQSSIRGKALLADAGRELIGNTFVVVYDYKYTNKETQAKKRKGLLNAAKWVGNFVPGGDKLQKVATVASVGSDVMGKGYFVRTTSYLYRLVWNDAIANEFYTTLWMDDSNYDPAKKQAFDQSNLFRLEYVGSELSRNNLQSTIFTSKSNEQLIEIATIRAVDKNIGKLQRSYETFRVKTPLLSTDPLAAKIGLKEGIEKNDKFEVLEQVLDADGTTHYERVGIIKVDGKQIWDNTYMADEANQSNGPAYTEFKGNANKLAPGMLIRQIN